jgi:hypothetical protein
MTIHYTGSSPNYGDPGDSMSEIQGIQRYAVSAKKPWEYNYVVDTAGVIWEYAGGYRAAHSLNNNDTAVGVLMLLGVADNPTDAMISSTRYLRHFLQGIGLLSKTCATKKHAEMGTTPTICPGVRVSARWSEYLVPWTPTPTPVPPTPPGPPGIQTGVPAVLLARWTDGPYFYLIEYSLDPARPYTKRNVSNEMGWQYLAADGALLYLNKRNWDDWIASIPEV